MKKIILLIVLALLPFDVLAAAITSKAVTGNLSAGANWVGDVAPVNGDTIVVVSGADITIDVNISLGNNASAVGHAFTVQGTSSSSYGTLRTAPGVTLTLSGYNTTTSTLGLISRYGKFIPRGSTIKSLIGSDYKSIIINNGILDSDGNTWQAHEDDVSWNHFGGAALSESAAPIPAYSYFSDILQSTLSVFQLRQAISNSAKTGIGSFGDTSIVFTGTTDSGGNILTNEVGAIGNIASRGDYFVDYNNGIIYAFQFNLNDITAGTINYFHLMYNAWGIHSKANTTYNSVVFNNDTFRYMGSHSSSLGGGDAEAIALQDKTTTDSTRTFSLTNSLVEYCGRFLRMSNVDGTSDNPVNITGNTIRYCEGAWPGGNIRPVINILAGTSDYLNFSNNILSISSRFGLIYTGYGSGTNVRSNSWNISNNTGIISALLYGDFGLSTGSHSLDNLTVYNNTLDSFGVGEANCIARIGTTDVSKPIVISGNKLSNFYRTINPGSNTIIRDNWIHNPTHHSIYMGGSNIRTKISNIQLYNNLFTGRWYDGGFAHLGYLNQIWLDGVKVFNNTFYGYSSTYTASPAFSFYDVVDAGYSNIITNVEVYNNLTVNSPLAYKWRADDNSNSRTRLHVKLFDYNAVYSVGDDYLGFNGQMQPMQNGGNYNLSETRNITGVAIFNADYVIPESTQRTLSYDATAKTLTWGNGDAVSISMEAQNSGSVTSFTNNNLTTYVNDSARNWSSDNTTNTSPNAFWLHDETTNTVHGIVWRNSATQIEVVPVVSGIANGDTYKIYKSEVRLYDSPGSTGNYIDVGIIYGELPTDNQSDTGIDFSKSDVVSDPQFTNIGLNTLLGYTPQNISLGSLGYGGTYIGAVRPQNAAPAMMGF